MDNERFENAERLNYIYNVLNEGDFRNYIYDYDEEGNYCDYINEYECAIDDRDGKIQKQKEVINKVIKVLEIQIEVIKEQPSDNAVNDNFEINQRNMCIKLLKEVSE